MGRRPAYPALVVRWDVIFLSSCSTLNAYAELKSNGKLKSMLDEREYARLQNWQNETASIPFNVSL